MTGDTQLRSHQIMHTIIATAPSVGNDNSRQDDEQPMNKILDQAKSQALSHSQSALTVFEKPTQFIHNTFTSKNANAV